MATAKEWKVLSVTSAATGTIPDCSAFMVIYNTVNTGTAGVVTIKNPYNGSVLTIAEGDKISINPQFITQGCIVTVTGDSIVQILFWL